MLKTYPKALKQPYSENAARNLAAQSEGSNVGGTSIASSKAPIVAAGSATAGAVASKPAASEAPKIDSSSAKSENSTKPAPKATDSTIAWGWPTEGKVGRGYSDSNKGIDIPGKLGQPVVAAADGKVVYSGNGLRGYGKLIIIKHDKTFLSAYAHNNALLVKEGQSVRKGQKIAEMGNTDADQVKLHFEIRRFGKPVDPAQYLDSAS
ncbi:peptidoglycan DD-metalloendopeptidase family protein [Neisseriaceae bacterium JH1-16]|nr:peptidoglycan DD-metalloendopeptidase family protein [Neisseriaceae bacterium JH1-16]